MDLNLEPIDLEKLGALETHQIREFSNHVMPMG